MSQKVSDYQVTWLVKVGLQWGAEGPTGVVGRQRGQDSSARGGDPPPPPGEGYSLFLFEILWSLRLIFPESVWDG